jgi:hypothetical protein
MTFQNEDGKFYGEKLEDGNFHEIDANSRKYVVGKFKFDGGNELFSKW